VLAEDINVYGSTEPGEDGMTHYGNGSNPPTNWLNCQCSFAR
jgi:hypothetical protein